MRAPKNGILLRLVLIGLCMLSPLALGSTNFGNQLEQADGLRSSNPKKFEQLLQTLDADTANATPDQLEQLRYLQAYRLGYSGQYNLAIQKASELFEQSKNVALKYRAGLFMINGYALTRDFSSGFAYLDKMLLLQDKIVDPKLRHDGLLVASILYNQVGQYELGKHYSEQILADNPEPRPRCFANNMLLEAYYNLKSWPVDDAQIDSMINFCSEHGEILLANGSRVFLARKWASEGGTDKATKLLEKFLPETEATDYPRLVSEFHSLLAEYKLESGDVAEAERHANIAVRKSASIPYSQSLVVGEKTLYEIANQRNDSASALDHYKKYAEADKAYLNDVKARELAYQLVKHETLQKNQTIALLNKKNQVLRLEQTVAKQKAHYGALLVILLGALLSFIILWAYRTKRMQIAFRHLAETDTLTGISNRDRFTKDVSLALIKASRNAEQLGMIMFDLDNFKSINDRFGHSTGDWVLKNVVEACKPICRRDDCIGRIGGEEFAILLDTTDLESATALAERFREQIAGIDTSKTGHAFVITASFGVTTTKCSGYTFDGLLSQADEALYQSKNSGRDRVNVFSSNISKPFNLSESAAAI